jgi:hypothetical protein
MPSGSSKQEKGIIMAKRFSKPAMSVQPIYKPRFVTVEQGYELVNNYHLARTALSGQECTPHKRMIWAADQLAKKSNSVSQTGAYKDLCGLLDR